MRDLGRVRRVGRRGASPRGSVAGACADVRRPAAGPELPRYRRSRRPAERNVRAPRVPARLDRLLVAERCARPGAARPAHGARPRAVRVRLGRQQGRHLHERSARVLGGRRGHAAGASLRRVLRQSAQVRPCGSAGRPQEAGPGDEERHRPSRSPRRRLAHRGHRRFRRRGGRALPGGGSRPRRDARRGARPGVAAHSASAPGRKPRRRPHQCRRPGHPVRGRVRAGRARVARDLRGSARQPGGGAAGRVGAFEPRRHARLCDGR